MASIINTRSKILSTANTDMAALAGSGARFVLLYLDPLTSAHSSRLEQLAADSNGVPLVAVVLDPPGGALLPAAARAELAASLSCIQIVVAGADEAWVEALPPNQCTDERTSDLERRSALMRHVAARHALA